MMKKISFFIVLANVLLIFSCSKTPVIKSTESDADKIYQEGLFYLEKGDLSNAENRFMKVISDFSYSKYEPFATVALGKTYYKKEEYMSAITVFDTFLKRHPNHESAPEALLYKGHSYLAQKPSDFFVLPNPAERDITVVEKAVVVYKEYLEKYPEDKNRDEGEKKLEEAELILIEKDLRIAEFYAKRKKCAGVFLRLQQLGIQLIILLLEHHLNLTLQIIVLDLNLLLMYELDVHSYHKHQRMLLGKIYIQNLLVLIFLL